MPTNRFSKKINVYGDYALKNEDKPHAFAYVQALCNMGILAIPLMLQSQSYLKSPLTPLEVASSSSDSNCMTVSCRRDHYLKIHNQSFITFTFQSCLPIQKVISNLEVISVSSNHCAKCNIIFFVVMEQNLTNIELSIDNINSIVNRKKTNSGTK